MRPWQLDIEYLAYSYGKDGDISFRKDEFVSVQRQSLLLRDPTKSFRHFVLSGR